ncbi:MAG: MBL fold metallo-hydrolase [Nitrospinota bacterium]
MIQLQLLGSGSQGNSTYVSNGNGEAILVDAGFSAKEINYRLKQAKIDPFSIKNILITHEHTDHIRGAKTLAKNIGAQICLNQKTYEKVENILGNSKLHIFENGKEFDLGSIGVEPFSIEHDAVDPVGFVFQSSSVKVGFVTDLGTVTDNVRSKVSDLNYLILEANHDLEMLFAGSYPWFLKQRIASKVGHLSNEEAVELLISTATDKLEGVTFSHLSKENNSKELLELIVMKSLNGKELKFDIASQDEAGRLQVIG